MREERPARLVGVTDRVNMLELGTGEQKSFLITTNKLEGKPVEVVIVAGRAGDDANADAEALGRIVSLALQYGVPPEALIKTLRGIRGSIIGQYGSQNVSSKADLIAVALLESLK